MEVVFNTMSPFMQHKLLSFGVDIDFVSELSGLTSRITFQPSQSE